MKTLAQATKFTLMALTLAGVSLGVQAQAPATVQAPATTANSDQVRHERHQGMHEGMHQGRDGSGANKEQRQAARVAHHAARIARLHDALKLTAAQEPAWSAYVAARQPQAQAARPDFAAQAALPAPQREADRIALKKRHLAANEARLPSLNALYAGLSADQRAVFDKTQLRHRGARHGWMGHGQRHQGQPAQS